MKIRIDFTVSDEEMKNLIEYARISGHDFDNPKPMKLVKRVLEEHAHQAIVRAKEYMSELSEEAEASSDG